MQEMGEQAFLQIKAQAPMSYDGQAIRIVRCVSDAIIAKLPAAQRGVSDSKGTAVARIVRPELNFVLQHHAC